MEVPSNCPLPQNTAMALLHCPPPDGPGRDSLWHVYTQTDEYTPSGGVLRPTGADLCICFLGRVSLATGVPDQPTLSPTAQRFPPGDRIVDRLHLDGGGHLRKVGSLTGCRRWPWLKITQRRAEPDQEAGSLSSTDTTQKTPNRPSDCWAPSVHLLGRLSLVLFLLLFALLGALLHAPYARQLTAPGQDVSPPLPSQYRYCWLWAL